ncbi:MAG: TIGR00159 family protein [Flavobacteriales bacterium]|nr:TIGR00159 family protein [Flavobacteriales bacterium]
MLDVLLGFLTFRWLDALDILIVAFLLYQLYNLVRGTAAINIFIGILALYLLWLLVRVLNMQLLGSILGQFIGVGVLALIVVFQQEIRRFLLVIGTTRFMSGKRSPLSWLNLKGGLGSNESLNINAVVSACLVMAQENTGAIIVISRESNLQFYANTGEIIDAEVSGKILESIFYKNSPLHDGAIIISGNRIKAARCVLPVTDDDDFPTHLGMRHRAAVGLSESSDAVAIVVSEQSGGISIAHEGELEYDISPKALRDFLEKKFGVA